MTAEYAKDANDTSIVCVCGNLAEDDGFSPATKDEVVGESKDTGFIICYACGRLIRSSDGLVVGKLEHAADGFYPCAHNGLYTKNPAGGQNETQELCTDCGRIWIECPTHGRVLSSNESPHAHP